MKNLFEQLLWNSRLFVIFAVVLSLLGAIALFFVASADIFKAALKTVSYYRGLLPADADIHEILLSNIIMAVDLYLIAVVLLIFAFGLYELFIAKIEFVEEQVSSKILEIHTLDQLKDKLAKVIVMVLIVSFFNRVLHMEMTNPLDMLYFAISIFALALALYFLHKDGGKH
ncbi:MAG: YqhA family protein [Wolinella sp.]